MGKFTSSGFKFLTRSLAGVAILLGIAGCADVMTYSQDAHHEGLKLYRQGAYADAAGAFRNSVRQNPRNYQGYYYLGMCYDQLGQYQQAIVAFKTARQTINLTLEGKEDTQCRQNILNGLASSIARSDLRDAETDAAQRDAQDHQTAESWWLLGKIYAYRGDADSAIDAYNRAALLEPNNFMVVKDYGLYLERLGQSQRAEAPLRRAYSLNSQDDQVIAALRRIGVVPGPSLKDENQLAKPIIPKGPIPEVHVPNMLPGNNDSSNSTVSAPRD